jgi:aquaporin Z
MAANTAFIPAQKNSTGWNNPRPAADYEHEHRNRMLNALRQHWPEYLIEAAGLGFFMISACAFGALLEHPGSPVRQAIADPFARRVLMGMAMALTAITIIYSPWGKRSGAHINPSVTLTFFRLGKIERWDAVFYVIFQFAGGIAGTAIAALAIGSALRDSSVNYVTTMPGAPGAGVAFAAEAVIAFILMTVILNVSNTMSIARYTGLFAASLVMTYISFEAPLSGMSMNPARTFGSAFAAQAWDALWIYFTAPPLGMLLAAEVYLRLRGARSVLCAKLHHHNGQRCIFKCKFGECGQPVTTETATKLS